jgi:hypothetical protein
MSAAVQEAQTANPEARPSSLAITSKGVKTSKDFGNLMCALISDVIDGSISPVVANAACNAGGKLLKVVEMEHKYGGFNGKAGEKTLHLSE